MACSTRKSTELFLFDQPLEKFTGHQLPTGDEVLRRLYSFGCNSKSNREAVVTELVEVWVKARIPTMEIRSIKVKLESDALSSMKNKEDQAFLRDQRTERKMAMGGVDQELVRKETMRMNKLARKSEMAEKEKMAKAEKFATWTFPTLRHRHLDPSSQENFPVSRGNIIAGQQLPQEAAECYTGSGLCAGQDEPLRPEGDPPPPGCGFQLRINACFPKHTSSIQNDDQDGACGGHQDLLPRVHQCRRAPLIVHWMKKLWGKPFSTLPAATNVIELILAAAFKEMMGPSLWTNDSVVQAIPGNSGPTSLMKIPKPSTTSSTPRIDLVPSWKEASIGAMERGIQSKKVREDYRELCNLSLFYLTGKPPSADQEAGSLPHARWMAKAIYVLKIRMFRSHVQMTTREGKGLEEIALFVVLLYSRAWMEAGLATELRTTTSTS
ncbi:hypothetical protein GWK47_051304 [Chionoecetes opilio]|uniref:Uncharacterized protein n=1 Tax=Chionoecetes opilio TaxID=41210 RepID=A0A8J5CSG0_CHIOP|nr:hypothetical protein GWK47_051304 [Chionoecetes opilio]